LKANSHPTIQPQRNVPLRLIDTLKGTLNDLERKDIIAKEEEPVTWVSNLVIVEEANKTLRLCLDSPDLNEAIENEDFKPPSFETISSTVAKFSRLLTRQIAIGTKNLHKNPHFSVCSIRLLADIDLRECYLVFHVQVKWPRKWLKNILAIFQVHYQFSMISSLEVEMNKNTI